jgi:hypothetical protein
MLSQHLKLINKPKIVKLYQNFIKNDLDNKKASKLFKIPTIKPYSKFMILWEIVRTITTLVTLIWLPVSLSFTVE